MTKNSNIAEIAPKYKELVVWLQEKLNRSQEALTVKSFENTALWHKETKGSSKLILIESQGQFAKKYLLFLEDILILSMRLHFII